MTDLEQSDIMAPAVPVEAQLDWQEYFRRFCEVHGCPVLWGGVLLFADGWTYSSSDHAGPEWPPPSDPQQLRERQHYYWSRRLAIVSRERDQVFHDLGGLEHLQAGKSQTLMQVVIVPDGEGRLSLSRSPVDLEAMRSRLLWLEEDVRHCQGKVREASPTVIVERRDG